MHVAEEIDFYWEKLEAGGDPKAQQCGWLKDRCGLSWQVISERMQEIFENDKSRGVARVMEAMLQMKKLDMEELQRRSSVSPWRVDRRKAPTTKPPLQVRTCGGGSSVRHGGA